MQALSVCNIRAISSIVNGNMMPHITSFIEFLLIKNDPG
jgi:hypothetical protein